MGSKRSPGWGLVALDTRLSPDTLRATGLGTFDSAYTEAGPIPGRPVPDDEASRWRPQMRGAQSVALSLLTVRGGYPGRSSNAAGVAYRLASESTDRDWRSWDEPNLLTDWTAPSDAWGSSSTWNEVTAAVLPDSHKIIVVGRSSTDGAQTWEWDPRTEAWTSRYDWTSDPGLNEPICMAYDEEGERLILWSGDGTVAGSRNTIAFQSTDGGASWSIYSRGMYDVLTDDTAGAMSVATARGVDWLAAIPTGAATWGQFASSDRGVSWQRVGPDSAMSGTLHHVIRTSTGFVVAYARAADQFLCVRLLASARSIFDDAAENMIHGFAIERVVGCRDYDGAIYLYATLVGSAVRVLVSYDDGASWTEYESSTGIREEALRGTIQPSWTACVPAAGSIYCIGTHEADTQIHMCRFGGWTNVEAATRSEAGSLRLGPYRFGAGTGVDYIALEFPETWGQHTRLGAAGTRSMSGGDIGLELICTQLQQEEYQQANTGTNPQWASGAFCVRVSAATQTRGGVAPTVNSGLIREIVLDNGTNRYTAYIEIASDGVRTHDGATQRSDTAITMTGWVHFRYTIRGGNAGAGLTLWYRPVGTHKWTRIANDVTLTAAATVAGVTYAIWGHRAAAVAGTSTLYVRYDYHSYESAFRHGLDALVTVDNGYAAGILGLAYGRRVPGRGAHYPVPEATSTSEDIGFLTAVGGPTYTSEGVSLPVDHTYDLDHVYPDESPSPRVAWRSTDTSAVRLSFDQGSDNKAAWYGGALALLVLQASPREFILEQDNGAGAWSTLGTLDKGWSGINYTLTGSAAVPRTGTATIARYFPEGELARRGAYMVCSLTAGGSVARRILRQSAGFWSTDATLQRMVIELEGIDGTEAAAGTGEIVHHSGLLIVYPASQTARRYMRIRIAATQASPDGVYEAGIMAIGRVVGVGADPSWDWSDILELSRQAERAGDDSLHVRRRGPPRRVVEYAWPDGLDLYELRTLAGSPDYIGVQTGIAFGSEEDAAFSILGIVEQQLRSGEVPAVLVKRLPAADGTITDLSMYLYGTLLTDAAGVHGIVGTEGTNEIVRLDSFAFEEIR